MEAQLPIGLFFGSFNPIHNGHLAIARYLLDEGYCCEVWFVVSPRNPWKEDRTLLDEKKRLEIVDASIQGDARMKGCDIEFTMPRPSYTCETLRVLRKASPDARFALIIGGDNLERFHLWKDYQEILENHQLFVYPRQGMDMSVDSWMDIIVLNAPMLSVSSTEIRQCVDKKEDISSMVSESALTLIQRYYQYGDRL